MTITSRQLYAAQALQALLNKELDSSGRLDHESPDDVCAKAFDWADWMLKAEGNAPGQQVVS